MKSFSGREADLFAAAKMLTAGAKRDTFLGRACGGNGELRARIEMLLRSEDEAREFFDEGRSAAAGLAIPDEFKRDLEREEITLGSYVGNYRIIEKLGDGGWGNVYLVEQEQPFRRRAALKIVRLDLDDEAARARFDTERQALAMMDHIHISRVYDAGTTEHGTPYFVLELVKGTPFTQYCDDNALDLPGRLNLFVSVCRAVQHAHQKGVIHGDIKPSNILITMQDGVAIPKVIDFGISKMTEHHLNEGAHNDMVGSLIGTPTYMSPEQADAGNLAVDTRSDIYSLGVLLYELLVGCTPFSADELLGLGLDAMRKTLRTVPPPPPSARAAQMPPSKLAEVARRRALEPAALAAAVRGDLDSITMHCLEKEPQLRYETASGLAMDVLRYLHDEPVLARQTNRFYRLKKLIRRNRITFAAAAAVALALVAGLGGSTWLFVQERAARRRAVAAEQVEEQLRQAAELRARITSAELLLNQQRFDEADRTMEKVVLSEPSVEAASAFRSLGEWHALQHRWKLAAARFQALIQVNQLDSLDLATLDYLEEAPVLIEEGNEAAYERFRRDSVTRFAGRSFPESDRILKACLMRPADRTLLDALGPLGEVTEFYCRQAGAGGDVFQAAWRAVSLAIWKYREGDYAASMAWSRKCLACPEQNAPRTATAEIILGMAEAKLGQEAASAADLAAAQALVAGKSRTTTRGTPMQGFWFDWEYAFILLHEAGT